MLQILPLILSPASRVDALISWRRHYGESVEKALLKHGALLFRGFGVNTPSAFARFVRSAERDLLGYVDGNSPRRKITEGVYTSTEYPAEHDISPHNELSYSARWPAKLYLCCVRAPRRGGETPLADSRQILKALHPRIVKEFERRGVRYVRNLHGGEGSGYSWQEAFETGDKRVVEAHCRAGGADFRWKEDGGLTMTEVRPATTRHPATGEEVWFNQADGFHPSGMDAETYEELISTMREEEFRLNSYYGDGAPLDLSMLNRAREVIRAETVLVPWREGDILILDNLLTAHGRMPFTGARKIHLAMT